jgi:nucleotide-binding universal stress UspA family protein
VVRHGRVATRELDPARTAARRVVINGAKEVARISRGDVRTSATIEEGNVVDTLLRGASTASLLAVGSRRLGPTGSMLLGSASAAVAARATCPVVVIRGSAGVPGEGAPVVAGIDPSDDADDVLDFAFEFAHRHQAPLVPVMCWHVDPLAMTTWGPARPAPGRADALLLKAIGDRHRRFPDVPLHPTVLRAQPVRGLVQESTGARLLVVGSHGRHAVTGTLLGSVSQGVLHHATCPVAVLPVAGS